MDDATKKLGGQVAIIGLGAIIVLGLLANGVVAVWQGHSRELWIIIGLSAILLMIILDKQGATVFLAVLIIGTLVAREEFLLEIAALTRGEQLSELRKTRRFSIPPATERVDEEMLTEKLAQLLEENKTPSEIVKRLESLRSEQAIERDLIALNDLSREIIRYFSVKGSSLVDPFDAYMKKKNRSPEDAHNTFSILETKGYVKATETSKGWLGHLTQNGVALAKRMGFTPVSQEVEPIEQNNLADSQTPR